MISHPSSSDNSVANAGIPGVRIGARSNCEEFIPQHPGALPHNIHILLFLCALE